MRFDKAFGKFGEEAAALAATAFDKLRSLNGSDAVNAPAAPRPTF